MNWPDLYDLLLKDWQVQLAGPLVFICRTYYKTDARQKISDKKIENVGDDVKDMKSDLGDVKRTLDDHSIQIQDVKHKMELTKVELQNKWEKYSVGKEKKYEQEAIV